MTAPPEQLLAAAREWLVRAQDDLRAARFLVTMENCPFWTAAFHCQQSAEKALKGYLVAHGTELIEMKRVGHEIERLIGLCGRDAAWARGVARATRLTDFAVPARYPGSGIVVGSVEAAEALALADAVLLAVRQQLVAEGFKI
jgi:HEPN domain-containing protein